MATNMLQATSHGRESSSFFLFPFSIFYWTQASRHRPIGGEIEIQGYANSKVRSKFTVFPIGFFFFWVTEVISAAAAAATPPHTI